MKLSDRIRDLDTFFAYCIALEEEAAERHDELADVLEVHNNPEVAATFRKLAHYSRLHAGEISELAQGRMLPQIAPWDFGWESMEGPETADAAAVDYLMNTVQALEIAMANERRAHDFYAELGRHGHDAEIRRLAAEFAAEEQEHLELLKEWLVDIGEEGRERRSDPDPPHMPE
jgi:rubrerythrin